MNREDLPAQARRARITGFLVVRNAVDAGYPFIEAIVSALSACDDFLVSDGGSSDSTWSLLGQLRDAFPEKIRLFRDDWRSLPGKGSILRRATNVLWRRCSRDFGFSLQANEIVPEASAAEIRRLPELLPEEDLFRLPFVTLIGGRWVSSVDFRRRLIRRSPEIESRGDAFDLGYAPIRLAKRPRHFVRYLLHREGERCWNLPEPVLRFRALFPESHRKKLEAHLAMERREPFAAALRREIDVARRAWKGLDPRTDGASEYWKRYAALLQDDAWWPGGLPARVTRGIPRQFIRVLESVPPVVRPLLDQWRYEPEASLARLAPVRGGTPPGAA